MHLLGDSSCPGTAWGGKDLEKNGMGNEEGNQEVAQAPCNCTSVKDHISRAIPVGKDL